MHTNIREEEGVRWYRMFRRSRVDNNIIVIIYKFASDPILIDTNNWLRTKQLSLYNLFIQSVRQEEKKIVHFFNLCRGRETFENLQESYRIN